jgi:hypothetical protein
VALPRRQDGWHAIRHAVLADGHLAILQADADLFQADRTDRYHHTVGELCRIAAGARARIDLVSSEQFGEGPRFPLLDPFPVFDRLPDGRWVVASARTLHGENARLLSPDGAEIRRIMLGDGINHLKIDDLSRIWVGWFDEGVFGNTEWRYPGLTWPPSAYGLAAFDEHGVLIEHLSLESIADCYALNVVGQTAWSCTYTDFPISCIGGDVGERNWPTKLVGASAMAVDFPHVVVAGGYNENANRAVLMRLTNDGAEQIGEWRLPFSVDTHLQVDFIDGRGDELHVIKGDAWHCWQVRDFLATL